MENGATGDSNNGGPDSFANRPDRRVLKDTGQGSRNNKKAKGSGSEAACSDVPMGEMCTDGDVEMEGAAKSPVRMAMSYRDMAILIIPMIFRKGELNCVSHGGDP